MIRYLPLIIEFALLLYAFLDCVGTRETNIRNLPKILWLVIVVLVPIVGPIAWLFAGRPKRTSAGEVTWPVRPVHSEPSRDRPLGPDDDPEFLATLKHNQDDHEKMLKQWEDDLKRREREFRGEDGDAPGGPKA